MPSPDPFVIVGAGLAGAKAAEALRAEGYDGPLLLLGDEPERPYERPPLSKDQLLGTAGRDAMYVHPPGWYAEHGVELRTAVRAVALDPAAHVVEIDTGERVRYRALLLATGSSARRLPVPGADLDGVHYLRTAVDADRLRAGMDRPSGRLVVIGAGWIGLEVAAAARAHGHAVTVLDSAATPLLPALGPRMGAVFAQLHRDHGVDVRMGTGVRKLRGTTGRITAVVTDSGAECPADLVVVGIGAVPNTAVARAGGLHVEDGVTVDAGLRTSAPDVYAAGDVANAFHPHYGRHLRVEHWDNALHSGPAAARAMLGHEVTLDRLPYFFTDQYDLGMEFTGVARPDAALVVRRTDPADDGAFITFWLHEGRVEAGMNVNTWDVTGDIAALVRSRRPVDQAELADPSVPLPDLVAAVTTG
ncbi:MAG: FAD-dependent oxidoreductase [Actinomycetota bacterium]|nr:FAD-dependent oxidoreductase [Actinomycetota bacterium]